MKMLIRMTSPENIGATHKRIIPQDRFGKIRPSNMLYDSPLMMMPHRTKLASVMTMVGMKVAANLPMNRSLISIGANSKLSSVLRSFSPTRLFSAIINEFSTGIIKKNGPSM
ncbi:hypothetical protein D3C84_1105400 [compost metagenome]